MVVGARWGWATLAVIGARWGWATLAVIGVLVLGCGDECPEGSREIEGRCVNVIGADAGGCDPACAPPTWCDEARGACLECRTHADCPEEEGRPRCEAGLCGPCVPGGDECEGVCFADQPTIGDDRLRDSMAGACVECNGGGDCAAGYTCDVWEHACVAARRDVGQCESCRADGDCDDESRCVEVRFPRQGGPDDLVDTYCALDCARLVDPDECAQVAAGGTACRLVLGRSGDRVEACLPATTTCEAYAYFGRACEPTDDFCSHDGRRGDADGFCLAGACSISCDTEDDCPEKSPCVDGSCSG